MARPAALPCGLVQFHPHCHQQQQLKPCRPSDGLLSSHRPNAACTYYRNTWQTFSRVDPHLCALLPAATTSWLSACCNSTLKQASCPSHAAWCSAVAPVLSPFQASAPDASSWLTASAFPALTAAMRGVVPAGVQRVSLASVLVRIVARAEMSASRDWFAGSRPLVASCWLASNRL